MKNHQYYAKSKKPKATLDSNANAGGASMPMGASTGGGKKKNKYMPKAVAFVQGKPDVPLNNQVKMRISKKESDGSDAEAIQDYLQNLDVELQNIEFSTRLLTGGEFSDGIHYSSDDVLDENEITDFLNKLELGEEVDDPDSCSEPDADPNVETGGGGGGVERKQEEIKDIIVYPVAKSLVIGKELKNGQVGSRQKFVKEFRKIQKRDDNQFIWSTHSRKPLNGASNKNMKNLPPGKQQRRPFQKVAHSEEEDDDEGEDVDIGEINKRILDFVQDEFQASLCFPPMETNERRVLHRLGIAYGLKTKSFKGGRNRFTRLEKPDTFKGFVAFRVEKELKRLYADLRSGKNDFTWKYRPQAKPGMPRQGVKSRNSGSAGFKVAENAPEISDNNVGHRLLSKMGWTPGQSIGTNGEGIINPVEVVVRDKRRGLGA